ncbi:DUF11 domain-containing protein [Candidatus Saccharibacteria bacterium]|nr:DUF11 domain-containing protein [Candidatus Saccharibacteria bacterium]
MKNIKAVLGMAALVATLGTTIAATNVAAYGDSDGGRTTYTIEQINNGAIDDKIVLNSISDNPNIGNELFFVQAREDGTNNLWNPSEMTVEDGKTYVVRMYVHNNNRFGTEKVATGVTGRFVIPQESGKELHVNGVVSGTNTSPAKVWDDVVLKSDNNFHLNYVKGSARIESNGKVNGTTLSDELFTNGVKLGYDSLNGEIPGCFGYTAIVSFKVQVKYDYDFTVEKKVRVVGGEKGWFDQVYAKVGDTVEYKISYKNTSDVMEKDVQILDLLGTDLEYVPGTTVLYNANNKSGLAISADTIAVKGKGINIGDYAAGTIATVTFRAKVVESKKLGCGADNVLRSWAQGYIGANDTMKQDYADVLVHPACPETPEEPVEPVTPPELPETGPASIAGIALGAGALTTAAGSYIASRKRF